MANSVTPAQTASDIDYAGQKLDIQPRHLMAPIFRVSDKACFKPISSATETSSKIEISHVASLHYDTFQKANNKGADQCGCACWSGPVLFTNPLRQVFSRRSIYHISFILKFECSFSK